jgi:steroid Delta-isomerase
MAGPDHRPHPFASRLPSGQEGTTRESVQRSTDRPLAPRRRTTVTWVTPREVFERYCSAISAADPEGVADLFTDDAYLEHPIGTERVAGRAAIVERYRNLTADTPPQVSLTGPVRSTAAGPAAAPILSRAILDGQPVDIDVIDVATFDDDGKITTLMGYWGPETTRPRTADEAN